MDKRYRVFIGSTYTDLKEDQKQERNIEVKNEK
jgi:hypothetical protein